MSYVPVSEPIPLPGVEYRYVSSGPSGPVQEAPLARTYFKKLPPCHSCHKIGPARLEIFKRWRLPFALID
jgi:hypothetical protein